jgi:hypothetical protein
MFYDVTPLQRTGRESYTYRGSKGLSVGQVVRIPLGPGLPLGVIRGPATEIVDARELQPLPTRLSAPQ